MRVHSMYGDEYKTKSLLNEINDTNDEYEWKLFALFATSDTNHKRFYEIDICIVNRLLSQNINNTKQFPLIVQFGR